MTKHRDIAACVALAVLALIAVSLAMRTACQIRDGMDRADTEVNALLRSIKADQAADLRGYTAPEFPKPIQPRHWGVEVGDATGRAVEGFSWVQGDNPIIGSELVPAMVGIAWAPPQL